MRLRGRLFVLVVLALAFAGVGLVLWHLHRAEQAEQARITAICRYKLRLAAATERLVRIRGDMTWAGAAKAVDDVLAVVAMTGVPDDVAIGILEGCAEVWPEMSPAKREEFRVAQAEVKDIMGDRPPTDLAARVASRPDLAFAVQVATIWYAP